MTRAPSISVVLSVLNGERYVAAAIESVLNQTHTDFEFLIINDGSTDETEDIINSFDDHRIRTITQTNEGLATSLNTGVEMARAPLIARMDADDWCYPDRLEIQKHFMDTHEDVVVVGSSFEFIDERNATDHIFDPILDDIHVRRELFLRNPIGHGTVLMRTAAVRGVGGYKPDEVPAEDYALWTRLARVGDLANVPENLYRFRMNPEGVSRRHEREQKRTTLKIIESLWDSFPFPDLTVGRIVDEGRRYRRSYRKDVYLRYLCDQYGLFLALWAHRRPLKALGTLYAAIRIQPMRTYLLRRAFFERRYYAVGSRAVQAANSDG